MSEIFDNAITSITLGIEDFESGTDARMLSAARNYYAGLLLLAKECLIRAVPKAKAMDIIGTKFKPKPNGAGGVDYEVEGYATVDLQQLRQRFKNFGLPWPDADIKKLQKFRNDLEHYHLKEPSSALQEAIASSFPMVVDFFNILGEDPQKCLEEAWESILAEQKAFDKIQKNCVASLELVNWPGPVSRLDRLSCPECSSSLIGQKELENTKHSQVGGKCFQCGKYIDFEAMMELIVEAAYNYDAYSIVKDGGYPPVTNCPECGEGTYVETSEVSVCFTCAESVSGECIRCGNSIDAYDYDPDYPDMCSYCGWQADKVMRE